MTPAHDAGPGPSHPGGGTPATDAETLASFAHVFAMPLRYGDTDRQGHVNNAIFSVACEQARVDLLGLAARAESRPDVMPVLARIAIDFRRELRWPGTVMIGSGVVRLGNSSVEVRQALFQHDACAAVATSVVVLMDTSTRRSTPWPADWRASLAALDGAASGV